MGYAFLLFVVGIIIFTIFRIFKKRSLPSNRYTPYDDITQQNIKVNIKENEAKEENK
ncbi:DUF3951 domain-containing protein [Bacillus infantis]|uniref:DUF3951 domain-containing protein n=1 Tax=Bacillus infantis TaxID=324767 RepID=UPI003CE784A9